MGAKPRVDPQAQAAKRMVNAQTPVDYQGMDPAMAATIQQDAGRRAKLKMVTQPGNAAASAGNSLVDNIKSFFSGKKKAAPKGK